ncbi:MAG: MarR family transcriptional regulator [Bacteroidota bacterium]|nr:MarR family transcriptional regulator [Bacteroidota bacterium]
METSNIPLGMTIIKFLKPMFRVLEIRAAKQTDIKLTMAQFGLLFTISEEKEEVILKDVAEKMGKDKSAILRMIDLLEKKELVRRVVDSTDRRKNHIIVTKKGEQFIVEFREIELKLNNELQEGLSVNDMKTFYKVVDHLKVKSDQLYLISKI